MMDDFKGLLEAMRHEWQWWQTALYVAVAIPVFALVIAIFAAMIFMVFDVARSIAGY